MRHISLFSGIGGFDLAAEWMGWQNVAHCEFEEYKRQRLKIRFPNSISYGDIENTDFSVHRGDIDILTGGFPCQDASIAKQDGKGQQGLQGERTGLFFEFCRAIDESRPNYVVAENVANILKTNKGEDFSRILTELSTMGYNAEWRVCRASEVGAPHHSARLYLVAYSSSIRLQKDDTFFKYIQEKTLPFTWKPSGTSLQISTGGKWVLCEPPLIRVDHGLSNKLAGQQIHGYGNAIVPEIAFRIFKAIQEYHDATNIK
ncbi:DNA cytosine methyltransferase [Flavobacterium sp.]